MICNSVYQCRAGTWPIGALFRGMYFAHPAFTELANDLVLAGEDSLFGNRSVVLVGVGGH